MEASSAINEPHPDATADDAEDFFGVDADEKPPEDPGELIPDMTPEEAAESARKYREERGEPAEQEADVPITDEGLERQARLRAIAEREAAEKQAAAEAEADAAAAAAAEAEADPTPPAESAGPTEKPPKAAAPKEDPPADAEKARGTLEREYIVFQKVPLTEKVLKNLLAEIEDGKAPEPRLSYFVLHRCVARNVNGAIAEGYTKNSEALGGKADLAGVSARAFQERHVEPKQVVETNLSIT